MVESEKDEIITDLIPDKPIEYEKRQRYISKYNEPIKKEIKKEKYTHRTFGLPQVPLKLPSEYLKKRSRKEYCKKIDVKHVHVRIPEYQRKLPSWVPIKMKLKENKCGELPVDPIKLSRVNFKKQNIIDVKQSQPIIPKERYVDTRYGDAHDLKSSGLYPIYINRKGFGKVPKIVKQIKCKVVDKELLKEDKSSDINELKYHCISEEERKELLNGMKKRWNEMMKQFQSLPFIIDTPPKVQRKAKLEYELQQLEKDITILERHSYICVSNDNQN